MLTTSHLYSFEDKSLGKRATEKIPLKDVTTIKSFYQNQYERPEIIRVESQDTQFYFSADNHQVKWAWMTAIEKMTYLATSGKGIQVKDSQAVVRETLRTSSVNRGTFAFAKKR